MTAEYKYSAPHGPAAEFSLGPHYDSSTPAGPQSAIEKKELTKFKLNLLFRFFPAVSCENFQFISRKDS